jgi:hypothetical protein
MTQKILFKDIPVTDTAKAVFEKVEQPVMEETFSLTDFLAAEKVFGRGRKARVYASSIVGGLSSYLGWVYAVSTVGLNPAAAIAYGAFNGLIWTAATYGATVATREASVLNRIRKFNDTQLGQELHKMMDETVAKMELATPTSN